MFLSSTHTSLLPTHHQHPQHHTALDPNTHHHPFDIPNTSRPAPTLQLANPPPQDPPKMVRTTHSVPCSVHRTTQNCPICLIGRNCLWQSREFRQCQHCAHYNSTARWRCSECGTRLTAQNLRELWFAPWDEEKPDIYWR